MPHPVYLLLLLGCTVSLQLHANVAHGASKGEEGIDPFDLARQLRAEICATNKNRVKEFYKAKKDEESRDRQFPGVDSTRETYTKRHPEVNWLAGRKLYNVLVPYLGDRLPNVTLDLFTWCIFPLSSTLDIYGCINSTNRWGSPGFAALGLLDIFSLKNVSRLPYKRGNLVINTTMGTHLSVLKGALMSCTIRLPDDLSIGVYFDLNLKLASKGSTLIRISPQSESFLVEGQQKNFTCESAGDSVDGYGWYQRTGNGQYQWICEGSYTQVEEHCNHTSSYQQILKTAETPSCVFGPDQGSLYHHINNVLTFVSPTVNDTGEVLCNSSSSTDAPGRTIYIAVVFTKLPLEKLEFKKGSAELLTCAMKAPSGSVVYWTQKTLHEEECQIPTLNESAIAIALCNTTSAVVNMSVMEIDDEYSMFHLELQISDVSFDHLGTYYCNVKYRFGSMTQAHLIQQQSSISVIDQDAEVEMVGHLPETLVTMSVVGSFLFCLLVGVSITVSLVAWVKYAKRSKRGQRIARLSFGQFAIKYNEVSLISPGPVKLNRFEFPRSSLELLNILGEGRFGKVYKGKAYGIVPNAPDLNTVAVKTTATDRLHSCRQQLLSELEILTKIQPHENICNLLASCTLLDGPLYVIIEYACHGNVKDYLDMCRETLLQRSIAVRIVSAEERSRLSQMLVSCDSEESETASPSVTTSPSDITDILQFMVPSPGSCADPEPKFGYDHLLPANQITNSSPGSSADLESKFGYDHLLPADQDLQGDSKMMWSTGYDRLLYMKDTNDSVLEDIVCRDAAFSCPITELEICDFAHQIANGLQHLNDMNIVHCDLAARNILIAEGFLLKIGDFGMARYMSSDIRYQRLQSNEGSMVAIKWAALEVLEKEIYSFKSDIWSYATLIWEIATYGSKPFADFTIGASPEPFIQHLKDGKRLPRPDGLSHSVYQELCTCWSADPNTRPSASSLLDYFQMQKESQASFSSLS